MTPPIFLGENDMASKTLNFYSDPGHGWLKTTRAELKKYGIEDKISSYSYQRGDNVYLEEDCDAGVYIKALKDSGFEVQFRENCTDRRSKIRSYDSYSKH